MKTLVYKGERKGRKPIKVGQNGHRLCINFFTKLTTLIKMNTLN